MNDRREQREDRRQRERSTLLIAAALSLLLHAVLAQPLSRLLSYAAGEREASTRVSLVRLSRSTWMSNKRLEPPRDQPGKDEKRQTKEDVPEEELTPPGQVVALPPPEKSERPDQADYASEYDRRVQRESRSRHQTPDYLNPAHRPQVGDQQRRERPSSSAETPPAVVMQVEPPGGPSGPGRAREGSGPTPDGEGRLRPSARMEIPRIAQRDRLTLRLDQETGEMLNRQYSEAVEGNHDKLALRVGPMTGDQERREEEGRRGGSGTDGEPAIGLTPDLRTLERLSGAPANDYLPDVEEDDATFLNTWRWKHAPFFNRVAESIRRQWRPGSELARRDPTGNIYGYQDRFTLLKVTIDREGSIKEINVSESCGVDFLDHEAVLAFRRAEPFANPPSRLFAHDDRYTFYFGFNVDFQRSPGVQLNWRAFP